MKFSVFTPTHNTKHLNETYESLIAQTCSDWEWVVGLNHGAEWKNWPQNDERVFPHQAPILCLGVGALKAFVCGACEGEYLVELDHDDLLVPTALEEISNAIVMSETRPDFLYSDCVEFQPHGGSHVYDAKFGWEHEDMWLRIGDEPQHRYTINKSFPLNASCLSAIHYAPNHVRVWRREFYEQIGGHDPRLTVCDDFDLVCRSYLQGSFVYIPKPLYLYRVHEDGQQTYIQRNAEIQVKQVEVGDRYRRALIQRWCQNLSLPMLDLGGGVNPQPEFESVDLLHGEDVLQRLRMQPESSVGCIRARDFLEHIPHCPDSQCTHHNEDCVVELMNQIYRVLVPGGWLISATPSTDGRGAFQDPTHCSFWNENSWMYYCREEQQKFVPGIRARFQAARIYTDFPSQWHREKNIPYVYADVVALKGQRQCGLVEI